MERILMVSNRESNEGRWTGALYQAYIDFGRLQSRAHWKAFFSLLSGKRDYLLSLNEIVSDQMVGGRHYEGLQAVPLRKIRGSEGRAGDFNRDFEPVRKITKERWTRLATAQQEGATFPPVQLVRVGDVYFVRDGHHRVSVARAYGQENIDAEVIAWEPSPECINWICLGNGLQV